MTDELAEGGMPAGGRDAVDLAALVARLDRQLEHLHEQTLRLEQELAQARPERDQLQHELESERAATARASQALHRQGERELAQARARLDEELEALRVAAAEDARRIREAAARSAAELLAAAERRAQLLDNRSAGRRRRRVVPREDPWAE